MAIRRMNFRDGEREFTPTQRIEGTKLAALVAAGDEEAIKKAGYVQDSLGQWFISIGKRKVTLESNATGVGVIGSVVTIDEMAVVPTPQSLQPAHKRGIREMKTMETQF